MTELDLPFFMSTNMFTRLLIAGVAVLALICGCIAYCKELESRAPIIETCVKHPSTRSVVIQ